MNRTQGSWFLLGGLALSCELEADPPVANHCGECRACLDACPTGAFTAPWQLDARRCISYLTIETRGEFPAAYGKRDDPWLFGCDICQEVCPWNHFDARRPAPPRLESRLEPRAGQAFIPLHEITSADDDALNARIRATPLSRPGPQGLRRNAVAITKFF